MRYLLLLTMLMLTSCTINTSGVSNQELEYRIWELRNRIEKLEQHHPDKSRKSKKRKGPNPYYAHNISIGNSVVLGNPNAPVTVIKFSDFQ